MRLRLAVLAVLAVTACSKKPAEPSAGPAGSTAAGAVANAQATASNTGDVCGDAYAELVRMAGKDATIPARDEFLPVCEDMPQDAQKCMNVHYTFKHMQDCAKAMEGLTAEQKARYDSVMKRR